MSKRLESYLEDLRGRLVRHFEAKRLDEVIAEMRSHVTYSARDAQTELGMESDEAVRSALAALGPVGTVAEDLVRQHRGGTAKSDWQVARVPIALYVLMTFILPMITLTFGLYSFTSFSLLGRLHALLPTTVLLAFVVAVWRSRRWLVKPMLFGIVGCMAVSLTLPLIPGYNEMLSRRIGVDPQSAQKRLAEIDREFKLVELGAKGYLENRELFRGSLSSFDGTPLYLYPEQGENVWSVPLAFLPFNTTIRTEKTIHLSDGAWNPKRAQNWSQFGSAYRDERLRREQAELQVGKVDGHFPHSMVTLYVYGSQIGMLFLANLAVLAASNRRRRKRVRRDPHLA
jgi:hypothetical protein